MKRNLIIIVVLVAIYFILRPLWTAPSDSIEKCLQPKRPFPEEEAPMAQLQYSEMAYQNCKYALDLNSKKYSDKNWKNMSLTEINSYASTQQKLDAIRETNAILEKLTENGVLAANVRSNRITDKNGAKKILTELKNIVVQYKFYDETSGASATIQKSIDGLK